MDEIKQKNILIGVLMLIIFIGFLFVYENRINISEIKQIIDDNHNINNDNNNLSLNENIYKILNSEKISSKKNNLKDLTGIVLNVSNLSFIINSSIIDSSLLKNASLLNVAKINSKLFSITFNASTNFLGFRSNSINVGQIVKVKVDKSIYTDLDLNAVSISLILEKIN